MSEDAGHELQVAIVNVLKADPDVSTMTAGRVYDRVPLDAGYPYISFGPEQDIPEDADCIEASEIILQIDVWSQDPGFREARRIGKAVKRALTDEAITLTDNALVYFEFDGRRVLRDPDGNTSHVVLTFRAGVEHH